MKYKKRDKIVIKSFEDIKREYWLNKKNKIIFEKGVNYPTFENRRGKWIQSQNTRTFTIDIVNPILEGYLIREDRHEWLWIDDMVECLEGEYIPPIPICSRFEILDL